MHRLFQPVRNLLFLSLVLVSLSYSCSNAPRNTDSKQTDAETSSDLQQDFRRSKSPLTDYVYTPDSAFRYEIASQKKKDGYTLYVVKMISQKWLTTQEVKDPVWWHWVTIVVPDQAAQETALLLIKGGSRSKEMPEDASSAVKQVALQSHGVVAEIHNVPNQPIYFKEDPDNDRTEDAIIAFGWRKFMQLGGETAQGKWLARFPMTKAAVRAMDVISEITKKNTSTPIKKFVVTGASKRGWTTWTTGAADKRVVGIAPMVIDLLHVDASFKHHYRVYGRWADAIKDYQDVDFMEWMGSKEYKSLLRLVDPYSFLDDLTLPKLILNATGDQFFVPDSWQFYWNDLKGEKLLDYIPNTDHGLAPQKGLEDVLTFFETFLNDTKRPDFDWHVKDGVTYIKTDSAFKPSAIKLWKATNPKARNFMLQEIGKAYQAENIPLRENGEYELSVSPPESGYTAYFVQLTFDDIGSVPFELTTGTVVLPNTYPYDPFKPEDPRGTH